VPQNWLESPAIQVVLEALRLLRAQFGENVVIVGKAMGPWSLSYHMMGIEEFLISTKTDPDKVRRSLERLKEVTLAFARAQMQAGRILFALPITSRAAWSHRWFTGTYCCPSIRKS